MTLMNPKRRTLSLPTILIALSLILTLIAAEVYAVCSYSVISQGSDRSL